MRKRADGSEVWHAVDLAACCSPGLCPLKVEAAAIDPEREAALVCLLWGVQTFPSDPSKPAHGVLLMLVRPGELRHSSPAIAIASL